MSLSRQKVCSWLQVEVPLRLVSNITLLAGVLVSFPLKAA